MSEKSASSKGIRKLTWPEVGQLIRTTFAEFFEEKSFFHGAALAYYAVFALVPMIYLSLITFGRFVGQETMLAIIDKVLREEVGLEDSAGVMSFLEQVDFERGNSILNVVGIIALLLSSSALLASLRMSINEFYDIRVDIDDRRKRFMHNVSSRLMNILFLPVLGLLIVVTYFGETVVLSFGESLFGNLSAFGQVVMGVLQHVLAVFTNVLLFAVIFKYLHDGKVAWKLAGAGAAVTAVLLYLGQLLIRFYLQHYFFGSSIGVAGTILIMLAWMYYSSQIIFLGAKFTKVYAIQAGIPITFRRRNLNARRLLRRLRR